MSLDIHPVTLLAIGFLISIFAPKPILQGLWLGGTVWLFLSAASAFLGGGLGAQALVIGQTVAWIIPGIIVAARTILDPANTPYGAYGVTVDRQQLVEFLTVLGSVTDPDPDNPQHQQQVPRPLAQWYHDNDGNPGDEPDADPGNADVFGGLDLDTDPLRDDPDQ